VLKKKDYDFSNCKHYAKTPQSTLFFLSHSEVDQKRFVTPCTQGKGKSQRCTDASYNQNRKSQKVELLINSCDHHKMVTSRSRCGKKVKSNYKFSNIRTSIFVPNTKVKEKNKEDPKIELKIVRSPRKRIFRGYFDKYMLILWSFTIVFYCYKYTCIFFQLDLRFVFLMGTKHITSSIFLFHLLGSVDSYLTFAY